MSNKWWFCISVASKFLFSTSPALFPELSSLLPILYLYLILPNHQILYALLKKNWSYSFLLRSQKYAIYVKTKWGWWCDLPLLPWTFQLIGQPSNQFCFSGKAVCNKIYARFSLFKKILLQNAHTDIFHIVWLREILGNKYSDF